MKPQSEKPRSLGKVLQLSLANLFILALAAGWPVLARRSPARPQGTPPNINSAAPLTRQQGTAGIVSRIAGVSDAETPAGNLTVTATTVPAGIIINNLVNLADNPGVITANVAADCNAAVGANTIVLTVSDGSLTATANLTVNVTANTPPNLGLYSDEAVTAGSPATIGPSHPPVDNGSVVSLTVTGVPGATVDANTGVINLPGNLAVEIYHLTLTAIDNCGAVTTRNIRLVVVPPKPPFCALMPAGLVGWYRANGNANDTLSTNRGVLLNGAAFASGFGVDGQAFNFDGVNDLVSLGNAPAILGTGAFSLEAWIKTASSAQQVIIQQRDKQESNGGYQVSLDAGTGQVRWLTFGDNAFGFNFTSLRSVNNGDWHHLVVTREADGRGRIYIDGAFDSEQSAPPRTLARIGVYLGGDQRDDTAYFNGQLDEVSFYDRALREIDAYLLFAAGGLGKCTPDNRPPIISAAAPLARQQGSAGTVANLAAVSDIETADGNLIVIPTSLPTGLTVTNLINTNGLISATVTAGCNAAVGPNTIVLTVTDENTATATANLTVNVTANTAPTLGAYTTTTINAGASATITPNAVPTDNGTLSSITASAPGFAGTLSVNPATGTVTLGNAGPAGSYTISVLATDNCGATTSQTFSLMVNATNPAPTITAATPITRQQGSVGTTISIATVNDDQTPRGNLIVTAVAPSGIAITNLTNANGQISANVAANCEAIVGTNTVILTVTDGDGLKAATNFIVNITANTAPELFAYPATTIELGASKTIFPAAPPVDNGTISLTATVSEGFTGIFATNSTTGAVVISNAGPLGNYTVALTAIDNCAALSTRSFTLSVQAVNTAPTITAGAALTRQQGNAASVATIATVNDGQAPPSDLIVTASAPAGLTISNISNSRGTITASVAAGCNATLGANSVVLRVSDGSLTATTNLTVNVTANTPPSLGSYNALSAKVGANAVALPSAAPADNGAITSLTASISSGFNGTLSVNPASGGVTINNAGPAGTYTVTVRATDNCGAVTTATFQFTVAGELTCVNPRAGLISWYRAEGNANDFKAANNGTLQNGVGFAPGQVGQAFSFNGTNEVVIPNSASLNPQQFTFEGWVNPTQLDGGVDLILNKEDEPFTTFHYELGIRGNGSSGGTIPVGNLAFALNGVTGLPSDFNGWVNGGGAVPLNTWTHIALSFNGTTAKTYLNGVLARSVEGLSGSLITSTGPLKIGSRSNTLIAQAPQDRFNGLIDELSLYSRALNDQEIQAIFNTNRMGKCTVPINTPPTITAAQPLTVQQGSPATNFTVATVNDGDTAAGNLTVTVANAPSGLTLSNITNTSGTITANVSAACNTAAGANTVILQVSDGGLTSTTALTVLVSVNAPPVLGNYVSPGTLALGAGVTVTPTSPPTDNSGIASLRAIASGVFTGSLSINPATGAVTISNARPGGNYTVTITATDNCGLSASTSFSFAVSRLNSTIVLTASAPPYIQGQPVTLTAMVLAAQVSAAIPSGTVTFSDGTTLLGTAALDGFGRAVLTTTALAPGLRGVTAVYNGDGNFNGATSAPLGLSVARAVANVSAASFRGETLAPEQIVAAFGTRLATTTAQAQTLPLPAVLGGTVVRIRDSAGRERPALLFYVSPTQVNYLMPGDLPTGSAIVTVLAGDGTNSQGNIQIARSNPGIFTIDGSGRGLPAAQVLRVLPTGAQRLEPVAVFNQAQNRFVAVPIDLGAANEQVFLILYGTGWRLRDTALPVTATLGGVNAEIQFIGAQAPSSGLDQANLRLPRTLIGRGEVDVVLTVDGKPANTVRVTIK